MKLKLNKVKGNDIRLENRHLSIFTNCPALMFTRHLPKHGSRPMFAVSFTVIGALLATGVVSETQCSDSYR